MSRVIVTTFLSLDGVMENPSWSGAYWNDEIAAIKATEFNENTRQLIGRVTYEGFAQAWPNSPDEGAKVINAMPKYVVSNTLQKAEWNNSHIINGDVVAAIKKLKEQPGDLIVSGSATLIQFLIKNDLVDDYHLLVYPVVVGSGKRLFQDGATATLKLVEARAISSGATFLQYQRDRKA